jgi:hypothetical protein
MALPPFEAGAVQLNETAVLPGVAELSVGASGMVRGVAESALEAGPVPTAFVAVTANE